MFNQDELIKEFLITVNYMCIGIYLNLFFGGGLNIGIFKLRTT